MEFPNWDKEVIDSKNIRDRHMVGNLNHYCIHLLPSLPIVMQQRICRVIAEIHVLVNLPSWDKEVID